MMRSLTVDAGRQSGASVATRRAPTVLVHTCPGADNRQEWTDSANRHRSWFCLRHSRVSHRLSHVVTAATCGRRTTGEFAEQRGGVIPSTYWGGPSAARQSGEEQFVWGALIAPALDAQ